MRALRAQGRPRGLKKPVSLLRRRVIVAQRIAFKAGETFRRTMPPSERRADHASPASATPLPTRIDRLRGIGPEGLQQAALAHTGAALDQDGPVPRPSRSRSRCAVRAAGSRRGRAEAELLHLEAFWRSGRRAAADPGGGAASLASRQSITRSTPASRNRESSRRSRQGAGRSCRTRHRVTAPSRNRHTAPAAARRRLPLLAVTLRLGDQIRRPCPTRHPDASASWRANSLAVVGKLDSQIPPTCIRAGTSDRAARSAAPRSWRADAR